MDSAEKKVCACEDVLRGNVVSMVMRTENMETNYITPLDFLPFAVSDLHFVRVSLSVSLSLHRSLPLFLPLSVWHSVIEVIWSRLLGRKLRLSAADLGFK